MKILILGLNYAPEPVGSAVYTTGMAEALVGEGHEVRVIAGQPYYPAWRIMTGHNAWSFSRETRNGVSTLRVPHYIPRRPTGLRRLLHHLTFGLAAALPAAWTGLTWRPDVVIAIAPALLSAPVARVAASLAGASSWLHVQDFEVEAAFATGLLNGSGTLGRLARRFERITLRAFDTVSAISPEMCRRLLSRGVPADKVVEFRNWSDTNAVRPLATSPYRERWGISTRHVALYAGNIAAKQGMESVVEAARRLRHREDLTFVVCGEGPNRKKLETLAAGLGNIRFQGLQPSKDLNDLLNLATVHLLPQIADAADLVLPSKLTNMLASGRPVVATATMGTGLAREIAGCGMVVPPGDAEALAACLAGLLDNDKKREALGRAARRRAEDVWAKDAVLGRFMHSLKAAALSETRKLQGQRTKAEGQ